MNPVLHESLSLNTNMQKASAPEAFNPKAYASHTLVLCNGESMAMCGMQVMQHCGS